jgi:transcriptional regulator with XRE-family HTH domain
MMNQPFDLLQVVLRKAREQGLSQRDVARRAGITPESLSRAKKAGDMRVSTLNELAAVVGLKLALIADQPLIAKIDSGSLFE